MTMFTIRRGEHRTRQRRVRLHAGLWPYGRSWACTFDQNCRYDADAMGPDGKDINKLVGFSVGWHTRRSYRLGWRCLGGELLEVLSYVRDGGALVRYERLCLVAPGEPFMASVEAGRDWVRLSAGPGSARYVLDRTWPVRLGYFLWPYFGGNLPAPHDMTVHACLLNRDETFDGTPER